MLDYLDTLRSKKEAERRKIAFGTAVAVTALIFTVWLTTIPSKFKTDTVASSDENAPLMSLKKNTAAAYESVKDRMVIGKEALKNMWK